MVVRRTLNTSSVSEREQNLQFVIPKSIPKPGQDFMCNNVK